MNLYPLFQIYSNSGEIPPSGIYMLRSAIKKLYEAYNLEEDQEIEVTSYSALLDHLEEYLKTQNKTTKVIRENKYWIRRLVKFGIEKNLLQLTDDQLTLPPISSEDPLSQLTSSPADFFSQSYTGLNNENEIIASSSQNINETSPSDNRSRGKMDKVKIFKMPFILKVTLLLLAIVSIGMIFIADLIHRRFEGHVFDQFQQHQLIIAQSVANGLQQFILELENEINFLTQLPAVQLMDSRCQTEINKVYQFNKKYIQSIRRIDSEGVVHFGVIDGTEINIPKELPLATKKHFSLFKEQPGQIHAALIDSASHKRPILLVFVPVNVVCPKMQDVQESVKTINNSGFIIVEINLLKIAETFIRHIGSGSDEKGHGLLINQKDNIILYHPNYKKIGERFISEFKNSYNSGFYQYGSNDREKLLTKIRDNKQGFNENLQILKSEQIQIFAYVKLNVHEEEWSVIVTAPLKEIHPIKGLHIYIALLMIGLICLVGLGSLIFFKVNKKRIKIEEEFKYLEKKLEMEDQIRKSEEKLRAILESIASDRISIIDRNLQIIWANPVAFQNYGEIIGHNCYQVYKGLDAPCNPCPVQKTFSDGKIYSSEELALVDKDGKSILYLTSSSPIRDRHGNIVSVVETSKDITERMRLQEEIKSKRDLLDAILTNMSDGVIVIDTKYNILFMNQNLIGLFGDQINKKCYRIFMGTETPCNPCVMEKIFKENQSSVSFIKENVKRQLVEISASALSINESGRSVIEVMRDITERKRLETQLIESEQRRIKELKERYRFGNIIGKSQKMQEIYELIQVVAQNTTTVLLLGDSGTGKELIARAIHYNSPQHDKPFVEVCCSVLSENLLESELFGHVKGAFTGAIRDKLGRFEMADGGSLFLDEVGDISLTVQVKLLRVIQEREFVPVGGEKVKKVNVRIIAATNKDLKKEVEQKIFREDLYYRLNVVPIYIPPLRDRKEDIPLLVNHFIEKFREKTKKLIGSISNSAMDLLFASSWPGNVRELENAIEHAFVRCDGSIIQPSDLPLEIRQGKSPEDLKIVNSSDDIDLGDIKKDILLKILDETDWNPTESAKKLKISRATFYRWLKKYDIKRHFVS